MKVTILIKYFDGFIASLDKKILQQEASSYRQMEQIVLEESSNIFSPIILYLRKMGHQAEIIIPNFKRLQYQWATENKVHVSENWQFEIPKSQIEEHAPDILFLSSNFECYGSFLNSIKPHVKKVCAWISTLFDKNMDFSNIDHVLTLFEPRYHIFKKLGLDTTLTHGGFDPEVLNKIKSYNEFDLTFIGGIDKHHQHREGIIRKINKEIPVHLWGYGIGHRNPIKNIIKHAMRGFAYWNTYHGEAWGKDMIEIFANSKITLNIQGDGSIGHAVNMRMFEATGAGTLLITEQADNIEDFFIPGKEVICFTTAVDAIEKIKYYLSHEDERQKIAAAGQKKTLEHYSFETITATYVDLFNKMLQEG